MRPLALFAVSANFFRWNFFLPKTRIKSGSFTILGDLEQKKSQFLCCIRRFLSVKGMGSWEVKQSAFDLSLTQMRELMRLFAGSSYGNRLPERENLFYDDGLITVTSWKKQKISRQKPWLMRPLALFGFSTNFFRWNFSLPKTRIRSGFFTILYSIQKQTDIFANVGQPRVWYCQI